MKCFTLWGVPPLTPTASNGETWETLQAKYETWLTNQSASGLLTKFQQTVNPKVDWGMMMFNWEAINPRFTPSHLLYKLTDMFDWYRSQNFHAKIGCWGVGAKGLSRSLYENNQIQTDLKNAELSKHLDINYIGGYLNFPTNFSVIHHLIREFYLSKAENPNAKHLMTFWHDIEYLGSEAWQISRSSPKGRSVNESGSDPGDYIWYNKPATFNQVMYNVAMWTVAITDGLHLWSDPNIWTDNVLDYPYDARKGSTILVRQRQQYMYARSDMKNVDWLMRGVYMISQYKSFVENAASWVFPNDIDDSLNNKKPLIAYKKIAGQVLFLVYCWYAEENQKLTHVITVDGTNYTIVTDGTWTKVEVK